jgi:DNA sulfur modification protein DndD
MYITRVTLNNFRVYYGENNLILPNDPYKNVFLVSGNNGFGKTTLLTSLVWGLYGKLMIDVDDKFKKEIYDSGGYKKYANENFNKMARAEYESYSKVYTENKLNTLRSTNPNKYQDVLTDLKSRRSYCVSIFITNIEVPGITCNNIEILRTYDSLKNDEVIKVLIDGKENELTKHVGEEIFINDFILPKEIAKFFFFDAEKIVSLAEVKSIDDKRNLSKAYSEVLGIKKYEDLKSNMEDLRIRFRRNSATDKEREKLTDLQAEVEQLNKLIEHNNNQIEHWKSEKQTNKHLSEQLQEKLIREGNSISVIELTQLKKQREDLNIQVVHLKNKVKDLLELAPFAIAGKLFNQTKIQAEVEEEKKSASLNPTIIKKKISKIIYDFSKELELKKLNKNTTNDIVSVLNIGLSKHLLSEEKNVDSKTLLEFDSKENNELNTIHNNLKFSFKTIFNEVTKELKNNRITFNKINRKISLAETKEKDLLVKEIRQNKTDVDTTIIDFDNKINKINQDIGALQREMATKQKVISELAKKVALNETDKVKDNTAKRIISELEQFIYKFKIEKKHSLEYNIKTELNKLMHKKDFVNKVEVMISDDIIDINLYNKRGELINLEKLSKGEQQLYATSLLKALVDESKIKFPVFIDSPLQKFDKEHSINIIKKFYPNISEQVILFPLLEKELSETEFEILLPQVNKAYSIKNINHDRSTFIEVHPKDLFNQAKKVTEHVYID